MSKQDSFAEAINNFRAAASAAIADEARERQSVVQNAKDVIACARKWVAESGIGEFACQLYETSKPWPTWAKRDDWSNWNILKVNDVSGGGDFTNGSYVVFTFRDHCWKFFHKNLKNYMPYDDCLRGLLIVNFDGKDVLELSVSKSFEDFANWQAVDIKGLVVGGWAVDLAEMAVVLERQRKRRVAESEAERLREQASKIQF